MQVMKIVEKKILKKKKREARTEQDSNLRGQSPLDFESNALTTRPSVQTVKEAMVITVLFHYSVQINPDSGMQRAILRMEVPKKSQLKTAKPEELILPPVVESKTLYSYVYVCMSFVLYDVIYILNTYMYMYKGT